MYPAGTLRELAARKARLRARIALNRERCAVALGELVEPLARIDVWRERMHRFGGFLPWAVAALGILKPARGGEAVEKRPRTRVGRLARWIPVAVRAARWFKSV